MPGRKSQLFGQRALRVPVRQFPDPILERVADPVSVFDQDLAELVGTMFTVLREDGGVGLAAPQVGSSLRVFVWSFDDAPRRLRSGVLVNPVIVSTSSVLVEAEEGCLSLPHRRFLVRRPDSLTVSGKSADGSPLELQVDGWLARIFGHEIDHLDGVLISRRGRLQR
jgi:peptide deformylase